MSIERETKSISAETTFNQDISEFRPLEQYLWDLTERVSSRLKANSLAGSTVTLKLKSADFKTRTRARSLGHPTQLASRIFAGMASIGIAFFFVKIFGGLKVPHNYDEWLQYGLFIGLPFLLGVFGIWYGAKSLFQKLQ